MMRSTVVISYGEVSVTQKKAKEGCFTSIFGSQADDCYNCDPVSELLSFMLSVDIYLTSSTDLATV